jgi:nucleoside-diphosphate-sugar epimerase
MYGYKDVRDVAAAHVLALKSPSTAEVGCKRIFLSSPYDFNYGWLVKFIVEKRPALKDRLIRLPAPVFPADKIDADFNRSSRSSGSRRRTSRVLRRQYWRCLITSLKLNRSGLPKE